MVIIAKARLLTKSVDIKQKVMRSLSLQVNRTIRKQGAGRRLQEQLRNDVRQALYLSPTVQELLTPGSYLQAALGLIGLGGGVGSSPAGRIDVIVETTVQGIKAGFRPFTSAGGKLYGGINIVGIPWDHADVLSLEEAIQINTSPDGTVGDPPYLEYLRWLLEYGSQVVVSGFYVWTGQGLEEDVKLKQSRTGYAVMRRGGEGFSIPEEHQGEFGNNFITRAVDSIMADKVPSMLEKLFEA